VIEDVYRSEAASNEGNQAIAYTLRKYGRIYSDPWKQWTSTRGSAQWGSTAKQLAWMGATLANAAKSSYRGAGH